jgi:hypothetical protein
VVIPSAQGTRYNDLTPRGAVVFDVFGTGKTALKFNFGKYLAAADGSSITGGLTQSARELPDQQQSERHWRPRGRTWNDLNTNFVVDCRSTASSRSPREQLGDGR